MELNFGIMGRSAKERQIAAAAPFRLAILGDFSAGANKGRLDTGDDLARRKPLRVDVDNIDQIIQRLDISVSLPLAEGAVEFAIGSMDDFHPDQIYEKVELFSSMADLRRQLSSKSSFPAAAKQLTQWRQEKLPQRPAPTPRRPRGATVPLGGKLSDFAALIGQPSAEPDAVEVAVADLLKSVVTPYIVAAKDMQQAALVQRLDRALAVTMRNVLHHPDFQILESLWRSVDLLTRRIETSTKLQLVLYDCSAEEFAADLAASDTIEDTGLYKWLVEQPALDAGQGALSAMVGAYVFDETPPQAELLGRMGKLAMRANAPFIASISPEFLETKPEDVHPLIKEAWDELRGLPEARYLALVTPRYLLRQPYGTRTDPINVFDDFEEFTRKTGLQGMLWGNPAFIAGMLLGQSFAKEGPRMNLGAMLTVGDMPYYFYEDEDGDQTALPCTERLINERVAARIKSEHFAPMLSMKERPEVRLGGFVSLAGTLLQGRWPADGGAPKKKTDDDEEPPPKKKKAKPKAEDEEPSEGETEEAAAPAEGESEAAAEPESSGDADLDSLLASLKDTEETKDAESTEAAAAEGEDGDMDPELAKLLKGL